MKSQIEWIDYLINFESYDILEIAELLEKTFGTIEEPLTKFSSMRYPKPVNIYAKDSNVMFAHVPNKLGEIWIPKDYYNEFNTFFKGSTDQMKLKILIKRYLNFVYGFDNLDNIINIKPSIYPLVVL
jgi:hypothetical protein